jgi:hypothetical protein
MPRKMKDLEWNFTAGPLRVTDASRGQWERLHATYKAVLPRADGTVQEFVQSIPHSTDDELLRVVAKSGVAQPRQRFDISKQPRAPLREVNTPLLRERLEKLTVKPLPKRPVEEYSVQRQRKRETESEVASEVFSITTVASRAARSRAAETNASGRASGKPSSEAKAASAVSASKASAASSKRSHASSIRDELRTEREARERLQTERDRLTKELDAISQVTETKA